MVMRGTIFSTTLFWVASGWCLVATGCASEQTEFAGSSDDEASEADADEKKTDDRGWKERDRPSDHETERTSSTELDAESQMDDEIAEILEPADKHPTSDMSKEDFSADAQAGTSAPEPESAGPEKVIEFPSLAQCVVSPTCALQGAEFGKHHATATLSKDVYAANDLIEVSFAGMPGTPTDWITIVPKTNPDHSWCSWQWSSTESGKQIYGSIPPGEYEVRLYYAWGAGGACEVIGRAQFTVTK